MSAVSIPSHAILPPAAAPSASPPFTYGHDASLARFSVDAYQRMTAAGILTSEDRVELLENYVVLKMPRNPAQDSTIQRMVRPLLQSLPSGWDLRIQSAIALADSQPEPDFAIVRSSANDYRTRHPGGADVALVIEVADSSLLRDQRDKSRIYASAGIPGYWIVNLVDACIEIHHQPDSASPSQGYLRMQTFRRGQALPISLGGETAATIDADVILD
jgi:Uma2 family endonuclease